ncbi:MAG: hypothetical protein K9N21_08630 [Deltaproteobacteria bacterium]|nr:hypothetical protein [Deltaproteobacteria bacterium]
MPLGLVLVVCLWGCHLDPRKGYPGPERSRESLALVLQTENPKYCPIYILMDRDGEPEEIRVDDLGIALLPGTYRFKAKLYHSRLRSTPRIGIMPVEPGKSDFPVQQSVLHWERSDEPYKETDEVELTVKAGFRYGLWCSDDEEVRMKVLGPYSLIKPLDRVVPVVYGIG